MNLTKILGVVAITFMCITSAFAQKKQLNVGEEFPVAGQGNNQTIVSQNGQYALSKDYSAGNDGRFYTHLVSNPNQKIVEFGAPHYSNTRLKINNGWLNMVGRNPKTNSDPNVVLFIYSNGNGQNTNGGGVKLIVENDGSLSLYSAAGAKVWSKTSPNVKQEIGRNTLIAGETLKAGERLISSNGAYILRMQEDDGHLCVYKFENGKQGNFVWGSGEHGFKNASLIMQADGNLVVYDGSNVAKWSSKTHPYFDPKFNQTANKPVKLVLENDGSLKLYIASGSVIWTNE